MIQKGDIFYSSWGYDQTNIDFCIVEEISKTGKTATCRMVSQKIHDAEGCAPMSEHVIPTEPYGVRFRLRVQGDRLRGSYPFIQNVNCRPNPDFRLGSFSLWNKKPIYQSHYH